jgi:hypothetical protein
LTHGKIQRKMQIALDAIECILHLTSIAASRGMEITMAHQAESSAREAGRRAVHSGACNPHQPGTDANHEWAAGWHEEEEARHAAQTAEAA